MLEKNIKKREIENKFNSSEIVVLLWKKLPLVARDLIKNNLNLLEERNRKFFENPDDFLESEPGWHQWGIITHSKMFEKYYREEIPFYLDQWGIREKVERHMLDEIDGMSKEQLLRIVIPLHDLGKFTERKLKYGEDGSVSVTFRKHEAGSGKIIRTLEFTEMLKKEYGLSDAQIEYIARCAELHFELGVVRNEARETEMGYSIIFAQSEVFQNQAKQIMEKYPDFKLEIGLLFLADSLAKTDIRIESNTDEQIKSQSQLIEQSIRERGLNPKLVKAVKQLPVNRSIAEVYLKKWAEGIG